MIVIYLVSSNTGSGKTIVAAGLGSYFLGQNRKTSYFKPLISSGKPADNIDVTLMRRFLSLEETEDLLSPEFTDETSLMSNIMASFVHIARGKDIIIMEGIPGTGQFTSGLAGIFSAKVIGVEAYSADYTNAAGFYQSPGKQLAGVILNRVPQRRTVKATEEFSKETGIKVLGVIPEDRALMSLTVTELVQLLDGEIVSGKQEANTIIENFMLGAMVPDHPGEYFGRKTNKAVILKSERSDMQLSALETPTRCLVLAGKTPPITMVIHKAEEKRVPIIMVKDNVAGVTANIEKAFQNTGLSYEKLNLAAEITGKYLDFSVIDAP